MTRSDLVALAAALSSILLAGPAAAYCRTSSCSSPMPPHTAAVCNPPYTDDCGTPIAWPTPCVEYSIQQNASKKVTFAQTETVMQAAFAQWTGAACVNGGSPRMEVTEGPPAVCDQHEYNQTAGNANIILYHDDAWPYEGSDNTLALTTVTYNLDSGAIYDADMELNSADNDFTVGDTDVDFDLLSIVTHESGHFLGMAHSHDDTATMWPVYNEHTTNLRTISPDDIAGICAIYPPGAPIVGCDPTPRHGFSPQCASADVAPWTLALCAADSGTPGNLCTADQLPAPSSSGGGCSAAGSSSPWAGAVAAVGALALAAGSARRRRRSPLQ
jgi:MYXO-CTERM domain-containing protein